MLLFLLTAENALKPQTRAAAVEKALPEGFKEGRRERNGSWWVGAAALDPEPPISWVFCEPLQVRFNVGVLDQSPPNSAGSGNP